MERVRIWGFGGVDSWFVVGCRGEDGEDCDIESEENWIH